MVILICMACIILRFYPHFFQIYMLLLTQGKVNIKHEYMTVLKRVYVLEQNLRKIKIIYKIRV